MPDAAARACVSSLQKAAKLAPGNGDYHFWLGSAYSEAARFAEAIPELTKASKLQPRNAQAWAELGVALNKERRFPKAVTRFARRWR